MTKLTEAWKYSDPNDTKRVLMMHADDLVRDVTVSGEIHKPLYDWLREVEALQGPDIDYCARFTLIDFIRQLLYLRDDIEGLIHENAMIFGFIAGYHCGRYTDIKLENNG